MSGPVPSRRRTLPPLNALRAFEAAARYESFALAASELGVTAAAVSRHVKTLEATTGQLLFERHPQSLSLTPAGREWLPSLSEAFNILEGSTARLMRRPSRARLSITVQMAFATGWLLPRLGAFRQECPDLDLQLNTYTVLPDVGPASGLDGAIAMGNGAWRDMARHFLFARHMVPVCHPRFLGRKTAPLDPAELINQTLIVADSSPNDWSEWFAAHGMRSVDLPRQVHFPTGFLPVQAAMNGLGIALADIALVENDMAAERLVAPVAVPPVESDVGWYVIHPQAGHPSQALRDFVGWLQSRVRSEAGRAPAREGPAAGTQGDHPAQSSRPELASAPR